MKKQDVIENWGIYNPAWCSVDVVRQKDKEGEIIFGAILNLCLDEGETEKDDMQHISFLLGIFSTDFRQTLMQATTFADAMFACPLVDEVHLWENGSIISSGSMLESLDAMFDD